MSTCKYIFVGNLLCLDFLNTQIILKNEPVDLLAEFTDFLDWLLAANVISQTQRNRLGNKWQKRASYLKDVQQFRSSLRSAVETFAQGLDIKQKTIDGINKILLSQCRYNQLEYEQGKYQTSYVWEFDKPSHLLAPIAFSACELFSNIPYQSIKQCENPSCILYYYDNSKNQKRRWCSMKVCGNRMKAATHYERKKKLTTDK